MEIITRKKLKITGKGNKTMTDKEIKFCDALWENYKHMLKTLPKKANVIISIDDKHRLKSVKLN